MKQVVLLLMVFTIVKYSYAQSNASYPVLAQVNHPVTSYSYYPVQAEVNPPGLRKKKVGTGLTIGGAVLLIGGIAMVSSADALHYNYSTGTNGTQESGDAKGALGVLMISGGIGMMVPGIIFWSKGGKQYNRYLEAQSLSLNMNGAGLSLRLKL